MPRTRTKPAVKSKRTSRSRGAAIQLNARANPQGRVLITSQDEDRFILPCVQAVEACRVHISQKVWFDELDAMFILVQQWARKHADLVHSVYAAPREGRVVLFVVPKGSTYDHALGARLTDLDLELARDFRVIRCEVLQIPGKTPHQLATFVDPRLAKILYG
jgi:hypothetical protein